MKNLIMEDYPWEKVEQTKEFITRLFDGPAPDRPGAIVHEEQTPSSGGEPAPEGLTELQKQAWNTLQGLKNRPLGRDDFVPAIGTGAGTCAMATAFGCEETQATGVYWVKPCITEPSQIDYLRKPPIAAGRLGEILEQTRAYAGYVDDRLPIRVMDFQSPFTTVEQMLGSDQFFLMPHDEPARLKALMDLATDFAIEFFQAQIEAAGPNCCPGSWPPIWFPRSAGVQMSDDNMVNVSPAVYEEFVVPYNNRVADAFGGLFLHSCTIREQNLPSLKKLGPLTGLNCDISTSVTTRRLLEEFGDDTVIAPHAYINTDTGFKDYAEFTRAVLDGWSPGKRLFIYPCTVLYQPSQSKELPFNAQEVRSVLNAIPAWKRDHPGK